VCAIIARSVARNGGALGGERQQGGARVQLVVGQPQVTGVDRELTGPAVLADPVTALRKQVMQALIAASRPILRMLRDRHTFRVDLGGGLLERPQRGGHDVSLGHQGSLSLVVYW